MHCTSFIEGFICVRKTKFLKQNQYTFTGKGEEISLQNNIVLQLDNVSYKLSCYWAN